MDVRVSWHAEPSLHLSDYGARGDGVTDDAAAVSAWLMACSAQQIPGYAGPGTYSIGVVSIFPTNDLDIRCHRDAVFKSIGGLSVEVIEIDGLTARPSLTWNGGTIDNSLRTFLSATTSGTALQLKRLDDVLIENVRFLSTNDYRDAMGDSGIAEINCNRMTVRKCYFRGQPDLGIYFSGGSSTGPEDDYGDLLVDDCVFYRCAQAVATKRQKRRTNVINCKIIECRSGMSFQNLMNTPTSLPDLTASPDVIVTGNFFKRIESRAIIADYPCLLNFSHNHIEDWGRDIDNAPVGFFWAVDIRTKNSIYAHNIFNFSDWSGAGCEVFRLSNNVIDAGPLRGTHEATGNLIEGNTIINGKTMLDDVGIPIVPDAIGLGIREMDASSGNLGDNTFIGVTTPITYAAGSVSKYGIRTAIGGNQPYLSSLLVGKRTHSVVDGTPGLTVDTNFTIWHTVNGAAGGSVTGHRVNRTGAHGPLINFYKDGALAGNILTHADLGIQFNGPPHLPDFSVAQLAANTPPAANCAACLVYVSNGAANKKIAVSDGTIWRYMDGTAV